MKERSLVSGLVIALALTLPAVCKGIGWEFRDDLDLARHALVGEAVGGYLYGIGGVASSDPSDKQDVVSRYDPAADQWSDEVVPPIPPMLTRREFMGSAVLGGKIYVIGGNVADGTTIDKNEMYDPATNTWSTRAPLPEPRARPGVAACNGKIYVFGGHYDGAYRSSLYVYDPGSNSWDQLPDMPSARQGPAVTLGHKIYLAGGAPTRDVLWSYDCLTGQWDTGLPTLNQGRYFHELVVAGNWIYAISGKSGPTPYHHSVEYWRPGQSQWQTVPSLDVGVAREEFAAAVLNDSIYWRRTGSPRGRSADAYS